MLSISSKRVIKSFFFDHPFIRPVPVFAAAGFMVTTYFSYQYMNRGNHDDQYNLIAYLALKGVRLIGSGLCGFSASLTSLLFCAPCECAIQSLENDVERFDENLNNISDAIMEDEETGIAPAPSDIELGNLRTYQGAHASLWDGKQNNDDRIEIIEDRKNDGILLNKGNAFRLHTSP